MVHLILTGATGLVGSSVLLHVLSLPPTTSITRLSILSRSPVPLATSAKRMNTTTEIEIIDHKDYLSYPPEVLAKLRGAKGVIWAQGISQNAVGKDEYVKITKDYPLVAADAFTGLNDKGFNFVYVSGEGATHSPGRFSQIFARVKGETELALLGFSEQHPNVRSIITRPGGVDGTYQPAIKEVFEGWKQKQGLAIRAAAPVLLPLLRATYKNMISPTEELGKTLVELAMREEGTPLKGPGVEGVNGEGDEGWVVRCRGLRRMGGLSY